MSKSKFRDWFNRQFGVQNNGIEVQRRLEQQVETGEAAKAILREIEIREACERAALYAWNASEQMQSAEAFERVLVQMFKFMNADPTAPLITAKSLMAFYHQALIEIAMQDKAHEEEKP